jgi:hypothetical protein
MRSPSANGKVECFLIRSSEWKHQVHQRYGISSQELHPQRYVRSIFDSSALQHAMSNV